MAEISKHMFDSACRDLHCSEILHPWDRSCWSSSIQTYKDSFIGSARFYAIIHLAQNALRGKKVLEKNELIKAGEYYIRSTILGALISGTCVSLSCFLRFLLGRKINYYTYLMIPNMINGLFILIEPPSRRGLIINLFSNLVIEYWLRSLQRSGYISLTTSKQMLLFSLGSALLFYLMRLEGEKKNRTPLLWLFTPEKVRRKTDDKQNVCPHDGPCLKYIFKGSATYFSAGLAFTFAKTILPKLRTPLKTLSSIRGRHFSMALFFGSYIGIYRSVICYLCRKRGYDSALYALPAGYAAGLSFLFKPNLGFAIAALTGAFKIYSTMLYEKEILSEKFQLPLIMYCICQGILFHTRFMHPDVCPSYVFNLMKSVTNGRSDKIYKRLLEILKIASV
ncbi:transmembrane protein 135 [Pieris rapae]|uniref:transmembrane protein 135 n=1 Tax=Pieris rapae TaxID=64459 RepID=UPI001E27B466|nr:transmembrane protein 135 [Pieris rapae]XP_022118020.2 transmembrane protein 135 [Pieris rapae]XP_045487914.1 transmembrane protein 135 [Pieris rapae]